MPAGSVLCDNASVSLLGCLLALSGCFSLQDVDAGPPSEDGGTVVVTPQDSGPVNPRPDAGPPPPFDAGGPPQVQITAFTADTTSLPFLGSTFLRWSVGAATSCAMSPDITNITLPGGSIEVQGGNPGDSVTYTLTCQGTGGPDIASVTVDTVLVEQAGATVTNSAQLNVFSGVNVVTGDLYIVGVTGLTDLSVLERLVEVEGNLFIQDNPALTNATLPNLTRIGGALGVDGNTPLTELSLPAIDRIESKLYVTRNPDLLQSKIDTIVTTTQGAEGIGGAVIDFYNDAPTVLGALNQTMLCTPNAGEGPVLLEFLLNGTYLLYVQDNLGGWVFSGSDVYSETQGQLSMGTQLGISSTIELEYDRLTAFQSAYFSLCWITSVPGQGALTTTSFQCPFAATGQYEERNTVIVSIEGQAQWDYTVVEMNSGGQQTESMPGAFVVDGPANDQWLLFAFPRSISPLYEMRYPTGRLNAANTEIDIEELADTMSPCPIP